MLRHLNEMGTITPVTESFPPFPFWSFVFLDVRLLLSTLLPLV